MIVYNTCRRKRTLVNGIIVDEEAPLLGGVTDVVNTVAESSIAPWLPFIFLIFLIKIFCLLLYATNSKYLVFPLVLLLWTLCLSVHEFGHAYVAYRGGDESVVDKGYLYLNPFKYVNWLSSLVLPIIIMVITNGMALFGAVVFINVVMLRSRWWQTGVALAGPLGTFLCLLCLSLPFFICWCLGNLDKTLDNDYFSEHLELWSAIALSAYLQLNALVLNLLPIPPLDGFAALTPWLSDAWRTWYEQYAIYVHLAGFVFLLLVVCPSWLYSATISGLIPCFFLPQELIEHGIIHTFPRW